MVVRQVVTALHFIGQGSSRLILSVALLEYSIFIMFLSPKMLSSQDQYLSIFTTIIFCQCGAIECIYVSHNMRKKNAIEIYIIELDHYLVTTPYNFSYVVFYF